MTMLVKEAFTYRFGNGKQLFVPVGAELEPAGIVLGQTIYIQERN